MTTNCWQTPKWEDIGCNGVSHVAHHVCLGPDLVNDPHHRLTVIDVDGAWQFHLVDSLLEWAWCLASCGSWPESILLVLIMALLASSHLKIQKIFLLSNICHCSLGLALKNVQNYFSGLKTLKCYAKTHFWIKRTTATASANVNNIPWHTDFQSLQHPYPPHWGPATAWHTHPCPATALNTPSPQPGTFNNLRSCSFCRWGDPTSHFSNRWKVTAPQE